MSGASLRWHVFAEPAEAIAELAAAIANQAAAALAERGRYRIVLAGGETPRPLYERLQRLDTDWSRWEVFFGDERCLPADDPGRNDSMARAAWLDHVAIRPAAIHVIPAELGAEAAATRYGATLAAVGRFDTTLLGLGGDGHTASLFPGQPAGAEVGSPDVLPVHGAPKPPADRVSLSARRLAAATHVELLAVGAAKREALQLLRTQAPVPIAAVVPGTELGVWTDRAAFSDERADSLAE